MTIVLSLSDQRILRWKRRMIGLRAGFNENKTQRNRKIWVEDETFGTSFALNNDTVTIINPNDEDHLCNTVNGHTTQYIHGDVSVTGDKIAFGLVYRFVMGQGSYSASTHLLNDVNTNIRDNYEDSHNSIDENTFITNLRSSYVERFY